MGTTKIEWCDRVWNPVTGCRPGKQCWDRCYGRRMANRLRDRAGYPKDEPFQVTLHPDRLDDPLHWRKPSRIFVCSMGEWMFAPWPYLDQMLFRMTHCPQHTFLTLTKEPGLLFQYLSEHRRQLLPQSVWAGVSVEDQSAADKRIPELLRCENWAFDLFISHEPALGPINYGDWLRRGIGWLISGGETGPGARPCDLAWLRSDRAQAKAAGVPWFCKQLGAFAYSGLPSDICLRRMQHRSGANPAEWPEDLRVREVPNAGV